MTGRIFVSYSTQDVSYVERLAAHLERAGLSTWYDREIAYGERFDTVIADAIDSCAAFVPVMTPNGERSDWVAREIARAEASSRPIVPILLGGQVFFRLGHLHYFDVRNRQMPGAGFVEKLRDLSGTIDTGTNLQLVGRLLVASPHLLDPTFARTVALISAYSHELATAIVLTAPTAIRVKDRFPAWESLANDPKVMFTGGPVYLDQVRGIGRQLDSDDQQVTDALNGLVVFDPNGKPTDFPLMSQLRLYSGCAGWHNGQLEQEMGADSWMLAECSRVDVLSATPETMWPSAVEAAEPATSWLRAAARAGVKTAVLGHIIALQRTGAHDEAAAFVRRLA